MIQFGFVFLRTMEKHLGFMEQPLPDAWPDRDGRALEMTFHDLSAYELGKIAKTREERLEETYQRNLETIGLK